MMDIVMNVVIKRKIEKMNLREYITKVVENKLEYTDCDGCTRAVAYLLSIAGIKFKIWRGKIRPKDDSSKTFPIHYWIETEDGEIWDFKSYKWLKRESKDCIYMKKDDVTKTFIYDGEIFKVLIELANTIGKQQDGIYEKVTGKKLHRKVKI